MPSKTRTRNGQGSQKRRRKSHASRKQANTEKGGAAIAEGGYGCVFHPAIACDGDPQYAGDNAYISKLMTTEAADDEMKESEDVRRIVGSAGLPIKFFGVPGHKCGYIPGSIGANELADFTEPVSGRRQKSVKCRAIQDAAAKPADFSILQSRYGGPDLYTTFNDVVAGAASKTVVATATRSMLEMLAAAIVPMNEAGLWHCDLKSENVLCSPDGSDVMMIDWGLMRTAKTQNDYSWESQQWNNPLATLYIAGLLHDGRPIMITPRMVKDLATKDLPPDAPSFLQHIKFTVKVIANALRATGGERVTFESIFSVIGQYYNELSRMYQSTEASSGRQAAIEELKELYFENVDLWGFVCCFVPLLMSRDPELSEPAARAYLYLFREGAGPGGIEPDAIRAILSAYIPAQRPSIAQQGPLAAVRQLAVVPVYVATRIGGRGRARSNCRRGRKRTKARRTRRK